MTMASNPQWKEVLASKRENQAANKRYDLISRVFRLKVAELMKDLRDGALGKHYINLRRQP